MPAPDGLLPPQQFPRRTGGRLSGPGERSDCPHPAWRYSQCSEHYSRARRRWPLPSAGKRGYWLWGTRNPARSGHGAPAPGFLARRPVVASPEAPTGHGGSCGGAIYRDHPCAGPRRRACRSWQQPQCSQRRVAAQFVGFLYRLAVGCGYSQLVAVLPAPSLFSLEYWQAVHCESGRRRAAEAA